MMYGGEPVTLSRDCDAVQIPSGEAVALPKGARVIITQHLGGDYTVITDQGFLARISDENADAIGKAAVAPGTLDAPDETVGSKADVERLVIERLKTCYDPEIPVNMVDLGLIYENKVTEREDGTYRVDITMTLTAPGCGMGDVFRQDVLRKVLTVPKVAEADAKVVFDPIWDRGMMSDAARLQLGMM